MPFRAEENLLFCQQGVGKSTDRVPQYAQINLTALRTCTNFVVSSAGRCIPVHEVCGSPRTFVKCAEHDREHFRGNAWGHKLLGNKMSDFVSVRPSLLVNFLKRCGGQNANLSKHVKHLLISCGPVGRLWWFPVGRPWWFLSATEHLNGILRTV